MHFGENLKLFRDKHLRMKQEEFSLIFNVSHATISAWENNKYQPNMDDLLKIEEMSGVPFRRFCLEKLQLSDFLRKTDNETIHAVHEPRERYANNNDRLDRIEDFLKEMFRNFKP